MQDIMLDLETMGNTSRAAIVQVAACQFDRLTGKVGKVFKENVALASSIEARLEVTASTIYWWLGQNYDARQSILANPRELLGDVLDRFSGFVRETGAKFLWCHSGFDYPILKAAFELTDKKFPFLYYNIRDLRTICDIAGVTKKDIPFSGTMHDALDDCRHQAKLVALCLALPKTEEAAS